MNIKKRSLHLHKKLQGKLEMKNKQRITSDNLALLYTPGVSYACTEINHKSDRVYDYTWKKNTIAIVTDGTAVLGLGDIGPEAALPVMEGKAILFKEFGQVNAIPICLDTKNTQEIIDTVIRISPGFGGINLEDISAPRCFEIEKELIKKLNIPIFHDDQHGTAVVVYAGLINALKLVNKKKENCQVVINGAGAAGVAIAEFLMDNQFKNILLCDRQGIIYKGRKKRMNWIKEEIAKMTNKQKIKGDLIHALRKADIFIGVSKGNLLTQEMIKQMNPDPIIFALANPDPEILPEKAKKYGVNVIATGRSDFPNQINNLLAFPGIFQGALHAGATTISYKMKKAAAETIARMIPKNRLSYNYFIPKAINKDVSRRVAYAVARNI